MMSTKPIVPRNGKATKFSMDLDGSPIADNWHAQGLAGSDRAPATPQAAQAPTDGPVEVADLGPIFSLSPAWSLASGDFFQNWTTTTLITTNDDWSGVAAMVGQLGQDITTGTGTNPGTLTADSLVAADVDVIANQSNVTINNGGVAEFDGLTDPTIALQGSGTADAPHIIVSLDATGEQNLVVSYRLRDLEATADNAIQPVALQYRIGSSGAWTNVPAAFVADATTGPNVSGPDILVSATLPAGVNNQALVQIRIMTTNAVGNDEWVGIDDIRVHSDHIAGATPGAFAINDVSHVEGDAGVTVYTFTVSRTGGSTGAVSVNWSLNAPGGALLADSSDFAGGQVTSGTLNFADGDSTSQTITINVLGDNLVETDETFTVTLAGATGGATISDASGTGLITNDDFYGTLAINDVSLAEGNSGTTAFTFTVSRTGGSDGAVSADYSVTLPGGAGADSGDFQVGQVFTGTVSFADGQTSQTITLQVQGDLVLEPDETFTVVLANPLGGVTITDGSGLGTITNDDAPPVASINDASVVEGADGISYLVFTVSLDHVGTNTVTVDYATSNGSALAGSDYVARSGQVSFAPGETSHTVSIPIIGDTAPEADESFTVTLSNPVNGSIGDGSGAATITNDDGAAYYNLGGGSFTQNWTNTAQITTNDNWSGVPYIIGFRGDDLTSATGANATTILGTSNVIDVNANQANPTTFTTGGVTEFDGIANPAVGLQGSGTADAPYLALYMDASGRSDIRVQANLRDLDASTDDAVQQIAVQYRTSTSGPWLNAPGGYFADVTTGGTATQVTAVDITLPADANGAATLEIRFLTTNAVGNDEVVGIDDIVISSQQSGPTLSIGNTAVFETDAGTTPITFTVTRGGSSTGAVTADYTITFPGGVNGADSADFAAGQAFTGQVSFADGQTSATITLNVAGDTAPELDENFTVTLSNVVGGAIGDGVATGSIVNDDGQPPLVSINDVTVTEGDSGDSLMTFTVTRTGGTGAFDVNYQTQDGTAVANGDYDFTSGVLHFGIGQTTATISVTIHGDTDSEVGETLNVLLSGATNFALLTDAVGVGTIAGDDPIYIHDIQGTSYFSPILAAEGIHAFNTASAGAVIVRAIVTAVDDDGPRQGYYLSEEVTDWDGNSYTSEGIFVMTRDDNSVGTVVSGVTVGDLVQLSAHVMEYQAFSNMPRTMLVNPTGLSIISSGNALPTVTLTNMTNEVMTGVTPDYFDSSDGAGDTFDASTYALSYFETVEGMLVTIPNMVAADGFTQGSVTAPFFQAYSLDSANPDQINARGGYTIAGDPPIGPPDTPGTGDDTHNGGRVLHDGDVNPDVIQLEFGGFGIDAAAGFRDAISIGDKLGDVTGIIDFDFTDRVLYVTDINPGSFVDTLVTQDTTVFGDDSRALTMAAFNVENLDPSDPLSKFQGLANAIANNLNAPDIISIEEIQDNNGATNDGTTDASTTWQMLVDAVNLATGAHYQWVDQAPTNGAEGGEPGGNIRVGFLYNTDRVQLGDLDANATLAERRQYTDRIGDGVRDAGDLIAYDDSMISSEIVAGDWSSTRRSLLGEFTFHGNTVYVTANHFSAKGGSGEFWQFDQDLAGGDPINAGWDKRNAQAQDVYTMLDLIEQANSNVGIISGGDYNDFYFYNPLTTMTGYTMADGTARVGGSRFDNLTLTLSEAERYTYTFDGRSQAIDHIIVNNLLAGIASYDVVHLNTGYNPGNSLAISDHDPGLSSYDFRNLAELLTGNATADAINGFGGDDYILTGAGDDLLIGGTGADNMVGGADNDTYFVDNINDIVYEAAGEGGDIVFAQASYVLAAHTSVEVLSAADIGSVAALDLVGNELANLIYGNYGDNVIRGGGGADYLRGFGGNDVYYVDSADDAVVELAGEGNDVVYTSASYSLTAGSSVEFFSSDNIGGTGAINFGGNELDNFIYGNYGANLMIGGGGADTLVGFGGDDAYYVDNAGDRTFEASGEGADVVYASTSYTLIAGSSIEALSTTDQNGSAAINLTGNELANNLFGNAGANVLNGGAGADYLLGLGGADTFAFTTAFGGGNVDVLADFVHGTDKIALSAAVFIGIGSPGSFDASAFYFGGAAHDADDRIIYNGVQLFYDADGNGAGAAVLFATLNGAPTLTVSDFQVI